MSFVRTYARLTVVPSRPYVPTKYVETFEDENGTIRQKVSIRPQDYDPNKGLDYRDFCIENQLKSGIQLTKVNPVFVAQSYVEQQNNLVSMDAVAAQALQQESINNQNE